jgi:hypothetical protein
MGLSVVIRHPMAVDEVVALDARNRTVLVLVLGGDIIHEHSGAALAVVRRVRETVVVDTLTAVAKLGNAFTARELVSIASLAVAVDHVGHSVYRLCRDCVLGVRNALK